MRHHKPPSHHPNLRIERWHRRCVYGSLIVLFVTGVIWLVARNFLRQAGQFGESVNPLEPYAMKVHGAGAMLMLFFVGSLLNNHIRRALKARRNLVSGWSMITTLTVVTVTGFGLYYLATDTDRAVWSTVHWGIGLILSATIIVHIVWGRRLRHRQ